MRQVEFEQHIGAGNICPSIVDALERARALYAQMNEHNQVAVGEKGSKGVAVAKARR